MALTIFKGLGEEAGIAPVRFQDAERAVFSADPGHGPIAAHPPVRGTGLHRRVRS